MTRQLVPDLDRIPLGHLPRPGTGPELSRRVADGIRAVAGATLENLTDGAVDATLDGADVPTLVVDVTGAQVRVEGGAPPAVPTAQVVAEEVGVIGTTTLLAHPLLVEEVPVHVDAQVSGLRFVWLEGADGSLGVELADPSADAPVTGHGRVAVDRVLLVDAARRLATETLAEAGFTLVSLEVDLRSDGPRSVGLRLEAKVRKGLLSASARIGGVAEVSDAMVLTVRDVEAGSRNPLVAGLLLAFRGRLEAVQDQRIDLAAELPTGVRIGDLQLDVGQDLVLSATLV